MSLEHTSPQDLVGFNAPLAAVIFEDYLQYYELFKQECKLAYCCHLTLIGF